LLWPSSFLRFFPTTITSCFEKTKQPQETNDIFWLQRVAFQFKSLFTILASVTIINGIVKFNFASTGIFAFIWLQAIIAFAQLELIVGLTRDSGVSTAAQFFRTRWCLWFGKISMSLYLIHYPVIYYILWIINGSFFEWPRTLDCENYYRKNNNKNEENIDECEKKVHHFNETHMLPVWAIPIVPCVAIPLAAVVYYCVEEPCRKAIRMN
jgi:peptidoglycan/LPS O-acetylase OafA/YrhL